MEKRGENIEKYISDLEVDLIHMLKDSEDMDSLRTLKNKYTFNSTGEPLDKSIGYHMCSIIEDQLGLEKLVACIKDPDQFIFTYQQASSLVTSQKFSEDFINTWKASIS